MSSFAVQKMGNTGCKKSARERAHCGVSARRIDVNVRAASAGDEHADVFHVAGDDRDVTGAAAVLSYRDELGVSDGDVLVGVSFEGLIAQGARTLGKGRGERLEDFVPGIDLVD